jgi:hypothetical protein
VVWTRPLTKATARQAAAVAESLRSWIRLPHRGPNDRVECHYSKCSPVHSGGGGAFSRTDTGEATVVGRWDAPVGATDDLATWLLTQECRPSRLPTGVGTVTRLPVEVTPTTPPSQCVRVLGYNLPVGPASVEGYVTVLVCLGPGPKIQALRGRSVASSVGLPPAIPEGASPVAEVLLPPRASVVFPEFITLLDAEGRTQR